MLENLIENALAHTPSGGSIDLLLENRGDQARVSIKDSGCGVPEAELQQIFEAFYQSRGNRREGRHAGLGLSIAQRIIELQGGEISASSEAGSGLIVTFTLPLTVTES